MTTVTAVFDLDGTLVDTASDLVAAVNRTLGTLRLSPTSAGILKPVVNSGARAMLEAGLLHHGVSKSAAEVDVLLDAFLADYGRNIAVESKPFPGAIAALERLKSAGSRLGVCTNKREHLARKLLKELKMDKLFNAITGRDTLPVHKPDPGHLIGTVILADGDLSHCVMIGDSEIDISTGRAAGIPVIGVGFGYSREPMAALKPDLILDHFDRLDDALARLFPQAKHKRQQ
jgi:phosphoglycolate phosphatase